MVVLLSLSGDKPGQNYMRQTTADDAPEIANLIQAVWADHNPNPDWIARVSLESNHATLVETQGDALIGFVDAFSTVAADGTLRWEVDLLGVHPAWRGRGIARELVTRAVEVGRERGAQMARALVRIDNVASLAVFERCGFVADSSSCRLYVSAAAATLCAPLSPDVFLILRLYANLRRSVGRRRTERVSLALCPNNSRTLRLGHGGRGHPGAPARTARVCFSWSIPLAHLAVRGITAVCCA